MVELNDFIHVYENSIDAETCDFLVDLFQNNLENSKNISDDKNCYIQYNLTENKDNTDKIREVHNSIVRTTFYQRDQYYDFIHKEVFPKKHSLEQFKIQKYSYESKTEPQVNVVDYSLARRFLSFVWFLNDVSEGGEIIFKDLEVNPEKGKLIIFPSFWMFPYKANPPIGDTKYLLTTHLHYK